MISQKETKTWWRPIWRGLVVDPEAKHLGKMGQAIWLFLYFVLHACPRTGCLERRYKTIAGEMGLPEKTIRKWSTILKRAGYISTKRRSHSQLIHIRRWKFTDCPNLGQVNALPEAVRVLQLGQSEKEPESQKPASFKAGSNFETLADKITINRNKSINNDSVGLIIFDSQRSTSKRNYPKGFFPRTERQLLAWDIASSLDDQKNLLCYISYCHKYPIEIILKAYGQVRETPPDRIKKSKGALFIYLVKHYAKEKTN